MKRQFEAFCADMGMTMTTAFNVCLLYTSPLNFYPGMFAFRGQKSLDLCGFPNAVERGPVYIYPCLLYTSNAETVEAIKEVKRMKADPSLGKTYSNVDQMMEELLADV